MSVINEGDRIKYRKLFSDEYEGGTIIRKYTKVTTWSAFHFVQTFYDVLWDDGGEGIGFHGSELEKENE